jgi:hypothetical protein
MLRGHPKEGARHRIASYVLNGSPSLSTAEGTPISGEAQAFVSGAGERMGANRSGRSFFADFVFLGAGSPTVGLHAEPGCRPSWRGVPRRLVDLFPRLRPGEPVLVGDIRISRVGIVIPRTRIPNVR